MKSFNIILVLISSQAVFGLLESEDVTTAAPIPQNEPLPVIGELGEYYEGDILLTDKQRMAITKHNRNGLIDVTKHWPNKTLVYYFADDEFSETQKRSIKAAMWDIANSSCVRFKERRYENEYAVRITNEAGNVCYSSLGYAYEDQEDNGDQPLNLGLGCFRRGTIIHEFLHALGFVHMQSTYNRDDYVCIVWRNIMEGTQQNFKKEDNETVSNFGVEYDYDSVLHYPSRAFSKNGRRTIIPLQPGVMIGQRIGMSQGTSLN